MLAGCGEATLARGWRAWHSRWTKGEEGASQYMLRAERGTPAEPPLPAAHREGHAQAAPPLPGCSPRGGCAAVPPTLGWLPPLAVAGAPGEQAAPHLRAAVFCSPRAGSASCAASASYHGLLHTVPLV